MDNNKKFILEYYLNELYGSNDIQTFLDDIKDSCGKHYIFEGEIDPDHILLSVGGSGNTKSYSDLIKNVISWYILKYRSLNKDIFKIVGNENLDIALNTLKNDHHGVIEEIATDGIKYKKGQRSYRAWIVKYDDTIDPLQEEAKALKITKDCGPEFRKIFEECFVGEMDADEEGLMIEGFARVKDLCSGITFDGDIVEIETLDIMMRDLRGGNVHNIGKYKLRINMVSPTFSVNIYKSIPRRGGGSHHPHVSSGGNMCLGTFEGILQKSWKTKDITMIYTVLTEFLSIYNHSSPYGDAGITSFLSSI